MTWLIRKVRAPAATDGIQNPKFRGVKLFGGQYASAGSILIRQKGTKWHAGRNVGIGRDWTLFALVEGTVKFDQNGRRVNVEPLAVAEPFRRSEADS